ncbi:MAG TPA: hypothetical protein VGQ42_15600 [Candidatus Dormibacteraeota bacterium]|jgi:hypothetical protein|nr:hypothetical protein [Candidatus Dormibacteraeota bacterium]
MAERNTPNGPGFIQANTNNSEILRQIIASIFPVGGVVGLNDLLVTANGTPNMTVNVAAGFGIIKGTEVATTQGSYHVYNDASVSKAISAADPTNPRKDLVVIKAQDAQYSGAVNTWSIAVVTGTPNATPVDPAVPNNSFTLARILVTASKTSIVTGDITDLRGARTSPSYGDTTWQAPAYANGWVDYDVAHAVGFRVVGTRVILRGTMKTGTLNTTAFTLPLAYRNAKIANFACASNGGFGLLSIDGSGNVVPVNGSNVYFSVDGVTFDLI